MTTFSRVDQLAAVRPLTRQDDRLAGGDYMTSLRAIPLLRMSFTTLAACAGKPEEFVAPNAVIGASDVRRIYLATDRILARDLSGTTERGGALFFAQHGITTPPGHRPCEVESSELRRNFRTQAGPRIASRIHPTPAAGPTPAQ